MKRLTKDQINLIINFFREGKKLPEEYKNLLFEGKKEYELVYAGKEREEDILAETMAVPLQPIKTFGQDGELGWINKLIFGDNLQILKALLEMKKRGELKNADGTDGIRLIYIDPPFASEQDFRGSKEQKAYQDKILGAQFLEFLRKRIVFLKQLLSNNGLMFIHLDYRKGHYMKVLMDEIFVEQNIVNEVIWHFQTQGKSETTFAKQHANIYIYGRNSEIRLHTERVRGNAVHSDGYNKFFTEKQDWGKDDYKGNIYYEKDGRVRDDVWTYQDHNVFGRNQEIKKLRNIILELEHGSKKRPDYWKKVPLPDEYEFDYDINAINSQALEAVDYPTQKPESLLHRIILSASEAGDIILDAFAGSGTTGAVAEKLSRRWIMIDSAKLAIYTMQKRLLNLKVEIGNKGKSLTPKPFTVYNAGLYDYSTIKKLQWEEYRKFALELFQCTDETHKVSGVTLDGYVYDNHVLVFNFQKHNNVLLDRGFIDDLAKMLGEKAGSRFFIISPAASVTFLEDYIQKDNTRYYILRIPYSIIEEIHQRGFKSIKQPKSEFDINDVVDSVGFDFVQIPGVVCEYFLTDKSGQQEMGRGTKDAVIRIKTFKSEVLSHKPQDFKNLETFSMVMVDYDHDDKVFDIDDYWFADEIAKNNYEVHFDPDKVKDKIMIIYMDIFGNEKREIKTLKDFKHAR